MDNQSLLADIVNLYRQCGKPDFRDSSSASCEILCNEEIRLLINNIYQQKDDIFDLIKCNESPQSLPLQPSVNSQNIKFTLNPPIIGGYKRFFKDINDLITNHTGVKKGKLPESFYLLKNDYLT
ncbi:MAG: hypothetical protein ACXV8Q_16970, partial [Methylobacter sp.]